MSITPPETTPIPLQNCNIQYRCILINTDINSQVTTTICIKSITRANSSMGKSNVYVVQQTPLGMLVK